MLTVSVVTVVV